MISIVFPIDGHGGRFDIAEFFTGRYIVDLPFKTLGFTAIPIFVKRMFRHSYIYVNTNSTSTIAMSVTLPNASSALLLTYDRIGLNG